MVFAKGSFVEAELRLECQRRPFVDMVGVGSRFGQTAAGNGVVDVLEHHSQDIFARIARLVERFVGRAQRHTVPRHVAEPSQLIEIEESAEEACNGGIFGNGRCVFALVGKLQQGVYAAQIRPFPMCVILFWNGAVAAAKQNSRQGVVHDQVALIVEGLLVQQVVVERVGE